MRWLVRCRLPLLILLCVACSGCTYETVDGANFSSGYSWWFPLSIFVGSLIIAGAGWKIREKTEAAGWIMMLLSAVAGLFIAPSIAVNGSAVDEEGFRIRGGLLGMSSYRAKYAETSQVKHTYALDRSRRRFSTTVTETRKYYLDCNMKDGSKQSIQLSSVGSERAGTIFVEQAKAKGVYVIDETVKSEAPF